jgi:hypothetical protein
VPETVSGGPLMGVALARLSFAGPPAAATLAAEAIKAKPTMAKSAAAWVFMSASLA